MLYYEPIPALKSLSLKEDGDGELIDYADFYDEDGQLCTVALICNDSGLHLGLISGDGVCTSESWDGRVMLSRVFGRCAWRVKLSELKK